MGTRRWPGTGAHLSTHERIPGPRDSGQRELAVQMAQGPGLTRLGGLLLTHGESGGLGVRAAESLLV